MKNCFTGLVIPFVTIVLFIAVIIHAAGMKAYKENGKMTINEMLIIKN